MAPDLLAPVEHAWFTPWDIERPISGAPLRSYHLARGAGSALGVTVFAPVEASGSSSPYPPLGAEVDLRHYERGRYARFRGRFILNAAARAARGPALDALTRGLARRWADEQERWLICDSAYLALPIIRLARTTGARLVYCSHNCESDVWRQLVRTARSHSQRLVARLGHWEVRRQERTLLRTAVATWCCSTVDARLLADLAPGRADRVIVVPNGVNPEFVPIQPTRAIERDTICFIGYLGAVSVHETCLLLVDEVLPRIRALRPAARLLLAGRDARPELEARTGPAVEIISPLADPVAVLRRARLSVVPQFQGGGTRIKILESLAAGRPVVATPKGAEGLLLERLPGVVIAESVAQLATAAVSELERPLEDARADTLRRGAIESYSWERIVRKLLSEMARRFPERWNRSGRIPTDDGALEPATEGARR